MTTPASTVLGKCYILLLDEDRTSPRWTDTELLGWLSDAQRDAVMAKPEVNAVTLAVKMVAGTKQPLPADCVQLLDIVRNLGTDGLTPGRATRNIARDMLDSISPDWHTETPLATVANWMYDPRNPNVAYVYPPQTGTGYVEMIYGALPAVLASTASALGITDQYVTALVDYVCYRAFSKDSEYASPQRAQGHLQAFATALGIQLQADTVRNPNATNLPFNPAMPAAAR